jgi:hypothetical protein
LDKSDLQEVLVALYLRLNGYLASGYIAHARVGNLTEIDIIAVRFPAHKEPEREVLPCEHLRPPSDQVDFLVGEVKGGQKNANFNPKFRERPDAIRKVLSRLGAFSDHEIEAWIPEIMAVLRPQSLAKVSDFPAFQVRGSRGLLRFVLFSPDQTRDSLHNRRPAIFGDDMLGFIWKCLRPAVPRPECATDYNIELWGHQFNELIAYLKDPSRQSPGTVDDLYAYVLGDI